MKCPTCNEFSETYRTAVVEMRAHTGDKSLAEKVRGIAGRWIAHDSVCPEAQKAYVEHALTGQ